jgi:hypothetical protein
MSAGTACSGGMLAVQSIKETVVHSLSSPPACCCISSSPRPLRMRSFDWRAQVLWSDGVGFGQRPFLL